MMKKILIAVPIVAFVVFASVAWWKLRQKGQREFLNQQMLAAAGQADWQRLRRMIAEGADIHATREDGTNILHDAINRRELKLAKELIDSDVDINAAGEGSPTPLVAAVANCDMGSTKLLLDKGARMELHAETRLYPLHIAARDGYLDMVKLLVDAGANLNDTGGDDEGRTALMIAVIEDKAVKDKESSHHKVIEYLLAKGADVALADRGGRNAMNYAAASRNIPVVDLLREKGAKVTLYDAVAFGDEITTAEMVQGKPGALNALFPDKKHPDAHAAAAEAGMTPLDLAIEGGYDKLVAWLLANGARPDGSREARGSPLRTAARKGNLAAAGMLLKKGADANAADSQGWTALHWATDPKDLDLAKMLLRAGAKADLPNDAGDTPLDLAVRRRRDNPVADLLKDPAKFLEEDAKRREKK